MEEMKAQKHGRQRDGDDPSIMLFENYERHYADAGASRWQKSIEEVNALRLDRLPRWIGRISREARILDAGCATGYILGLLHAHGYTNLAGVELSSQLVPIARKELPKSVRIVHRDIRDFLAECEDGAFEVILCHHVLEHIPRDSIIPLLRDFHRCLTPGGYLGVKVPNASFLLAGNHLFCDFTHVVHFNERSLPQVLEGAGFDPHKIEFVLHPPKLFWSSQHPLRAGLRLLNRLRWHTHRIVHRILCGLIDQHPVPYVFEAELEAVVQR